MPLDATIHCTNQPTSKRDACATNSHDIFLIPRPADVVRSHCIAFIATVSSVQLPYVGLSVGMFDCLSDTTLFAVAVSVCEVLFLFTFVILFLRFLFFSSLQLSLKSGHFYTLNWIISPSYLVLYFFFVFIFGFFNLFVVLIHTVLCWTLLTFFPSFFFVSWIEILLLLLLSINIVYFHYLIGLFCMCLCCCKKLFMYCCCCSCCFFENSSVSALSSAVCNYLYRIMTYDDVFIKKNPMFSAISWHYLVNLIYLKINIKKWNIYATKLSFISLSEYNTKWRKSIPSMANGLLCHYATLCFVK